MVSGFYRYLKSKANIQERQKYTIITFIIVIYQSCFPLQLLDNSLGISEQYRKGTSGLQKTET